MIINPLTDAERGYQRRLFRLALGHLRWCLFTHRALIVSCQERHLTAPLNSLDEESPLDFDQKRQIHLEKPCLRFSEGSIATIRIESEFAQIDLKSKVLLCNDERLSLEFDLDSAEIKIVHAVESPIDSSPERKSPGILLFAMDPHGNVRNEGAYFILGKSFVDGFFATPPENFKAAKGTMFYSPEFNLTSDHTMAEGKWIFKWHQTRPADLLRWVKGKFEIICAGLIASAPAGKTLVKLFFDAGAINANFALDYRYHLEQFVRDIDRMPGGPPDLLRMMEIDREGRICGSISFLRYGEDLWMWCDLASRPSLEPRPLSTLARDHTDLLRAVLEQHGSPQWVIAMWTDGHRYWQAFKNYLQSDESLKATRIEASYLRFPKRALASGTSIVVRDVSDLQSLEAAALGGMESDFHFQSEEAKFLAHALAFNVTPGRHSDTENSNGRLWRKFFLVTTHQDENEVKFLLVVAICSSGASVNLAAQDAWLFPLGDADPTEARLWKIIDSLRIEPELPFSALLYVAPWSRISCEAKNHNECWIFDSSALQFWGDSAQYLLPQASK